MTAYLIANYDVTDPEAYREYQGKSAPILEGGTVVVFDAASVAKEGTPGAQTVVISYPDKEAALAAYESDGYQSVVGIRLGAIENGRAIIVDGFELPTGS